MEIKDEIFEGFFKKLEEDNHFPNAIIQGLKELLKSEEIDSQEKILDVIREGSRHVNTNQED